MFCSAKCHIRSFYIVNLLLGVLFFNLFFDVLLMDLLMELRKYNCGPVLMTRVGYLGVIYGPVNNVLYIDVVRSNTTADVVYCVVQAATHILRHHNFVVTKIQNGDVLIFCATTADASILHNERRDFICKMCFKLINKIDSVDFNYDNHPPVVSNNLFGHFAVELELN
jgi:hypothetical protein